MRVDIVTLFAEAFEGFLSASFVGRAIRAEKLNVRFRSPREFGLGKHRSVDDTPYGGGSGMVMRVDVLLPCIESLDADAPEGLCAHRVLLTPQGAPLDQAKVTELAARPAILLVCGRYEGFDERVRAYVDEEISLGDFVLTGGEVAAMVIVDACVRLLPGVLGNESSPKMESFSPEADGLLEYPQYTRPLEYRGSVVPEILTRGNHAEIDAWRRRESVYRTRQRRPELFQRASQSAARSAVDFGNSKREKSE